MAEGPTKAAPRKPFCGDGDIEAGPARDASCADSCSSLDDLRRPGSRPASRPTSELGSPKWETPQISASGRAKWEPGDADDDDGGDHQPNGGSFLRRWRCSRGGTAALVCMLLMLGSFAVPRSSSGLGSVKLSVTDLGSRATAGVRASMRRSGRPAADDAAMSQPKRNCRPKPRGANSTVQVGLRIWSKRQ